MYVQARLHALYMCMHAYVCLHTTSGSLASTPGIMTSYMCLHTLVCMRPCYCFDPGDPRPPNSFSLGFTVCPMRLVPGPRWGHWVLVHRLGLPNRMLAPGCQGQAHSACCCGCLLPQEVSEKFRQGTGLSHPWRQRLPVRDSAAGSGNYPHMTHWRGRVPGSG